MFLARCTIPVNNIVEISLVDFLTCVTHFHMDLKMNLLSYTEKEQL